MVASEEKGEERVRSWIWGFVPARCTFTHLNGLTARDDLEVPVKLRQCYFPVVSMVLSGFGANGGLRISGLRIRELVSKARRTRKRIEGLAKSQSSSSSAARPKSLRPPFISRNESLGIHGNLPLPASAKE